MFGRHLRHRRAVLGRQGFEHRCLHDPFEPVEPGNVPGKQVVLDDPSIPGPVGGDDGEVAFLDHRGLTRGLAAHEVGAIFAVITSRGTRKPIFPLTAGRHALC